MIDPKRDLKGATPEKLARALLRPSVKKREPEETEQSNETKSGKLGTGGGTKTVIGDKVTV